MVTNKLSFDFIKSNVSQGLCGTISLNLDSNINIRMVNKGE